MAQGLAGSGDQRRYGSTDGVPEVAFASGWGRGGLAGGGLAGLDNGTSQFSPTELYNLCENITTNIYTINTSRKTLERELRMVGTARDNEGLRDRVHVTHISSNELVTQTYRELARLTEVVRHGNKEQKLQAERLKEEFSQTVTDYGKIQKQISEKMKQHLLIANAANSDFDKNEDDSERLIASEQQFHEQKLKQQEIEFEAGLMEERALRIQAIESDIIDVNQIVRDLSTMVFVQGVGVSSIEDNIESVHGNVQLGRQELEKAASHQNKYRRKVICLLMTAVIAAIILGIIIYFSIKRFSAVKANFGLFGSERPMLTSVDITEVDVNISRPMSTNLLEVAETLAEMHEITFIS